MGTFIRFCHHNGLSLDFITESTLDRLENYKVLFLFGASAISEKESAAILEFVKNGGTVIADLNPGIINENISLLDNNPLQDLFGNITYKNTEAPTSAQLNIDTMYKNRRLLLQSKKANTIAGSIPFVIKHYGKGDAVLLNFNTSSFELESL
jgi:beta-galactosidase GanA